MSRYFLIIAIVILGMLMYGAYQEKSGYVRTDDEVVQSSEKHLIRKVTVLQGHEFDITFVDGRRILGQLDLQTTPEAKKAVINLINASSKPVCVVFDQKEDFWIVDLILENEDQTLVLSNWLRQHKLVWDN